MFNDVKLLNLDCKEFGFVCCSRGFELRNVVVFLGCCVCVEEL